MKFKIVLTTLIAYTTLTVFAHEPQNLSFVKQQLKQYYNTGRYDYDINKVENQAKDYLLMRVRENQQAKTKKKLAIVLDIDETSLSNYPFNASRDFDVSGAQIDQHMAEGNDPAISQTLVLYQVAQKMHVHVFFVTGRFKKYTAITASNLKKVGYAAWQGLYLKPNNYSFHSAVPYKAATRKKIEQEGYDIIFSMGDQYSDLNGGYADRIFKLPNPFYFVP